MHTAVLSVRWAQYLQQTQWFRKKHNVHMCVNYIERIIKPERQNVNNRWMWVKACGRSTYNSSNFPVIFKTMSKSKCVKIFRAVI